MVLKAPEGVQDVYDTVGFRDPHSGLVVECWMLDEEEMAEVVKTRKIWVQINGPVPAMSVTALSPMIYDEQATERDQLIELAKRYRAFQEIIKTVPDHFFQGENVFAETMRKIRVEAYDG